MILLLLRLVMLLLLPGETLIEPLLKACSVVPATVVVSPVPTAVVIRTWCEAESMPGPHIIAVVDSLCFQLLNSFSSWIFSTSDFLNSKL